MNRLPISWIPTFDQLDSLLAASGTRSHDCNASAVKVSGSCFQAHLAGGLWVYGTRHSSHLFIYHVLSGYIPAGTLSRVRRLQNGDSLYTVPASPSESLPAWHNLPAWRIAAQLLELGPTPHAVNESGIAYYRIAPSGELSGEPICLETLPPDLGVLPSSTRPTIGEWLTDCQLQHSRFRASAGNFVPLLRERLTVGPPADVQLLWHRSNIISERPDHLLLHVVMPPHGIMPAKTLLVRVQMHSRESRKMFGITGEAANADLYITADDETDLANRRMQWKCAQDAVDEIAEWVLSNVVIPGPENL